MIRILLFVLIIAPKYINAQVFYKWKLYKYKSIYGDLLSDQVKNSIFDTSIDDNTYPLFNGEIVSQDDLIKFTDDSVTNVDGRECYLTKLQSFIISHKRQSHINYVLEYRSSGIKSSDPILIIYSPSYGIIMKSYPIEYLQNYFFLDNKQLSIKLNNRPYRHHDLVRIRKKILKIFRPARGVNG